MYMILNEGIDSQRIDVFFDVYRDNLIKNPKREREARKTVMNSETLRQTTRFLSNSKNKSLLMKFIAEEWQNERHRERLAKVTFSLTAEKYCYEVSSIGKKTREELRSTQEEADTRVFHLAAYATAEGYRAVVITSGDTYVYLFSLWPLKASSHVLGLANAVNKLEQHTYTSIESFECWGQNCVDLSLVSTTSPAAAVSVLFRERAR